MIKSYRQDKKIRQDQLCVYFNSEVKPGSFIQFSTTIDIIIKNDANELLIIHMATHETLKKFDMKRNFKINNTKIKNHCVGCV